MSGAPLPHGIRLLADAAGMDAALSIAAKFGGARLFIPKKPGGQVQDVVGAPAAAALSAALGGLTLFIPQAARVLNDHLRELGQSQEKRARTLKKSRSTIQKWDCQDLVDAKQGELF